MEQSSGVHIELNETKIIELIEKYEKIILEQQKTTEEIIKLQGLISSLQSNIDKTQTAISETRTNIDKLKTQLNEKTPKVIFSELETIVKTHTKAIDATSKKLFEVQNNVMLFTQQPVSHTIIDTIRRQLTEEIMANTRAIIDEQTTITHNLIETKNTEVRGMINNVKRFAYH